MANTLEALKSNSSLIAHRVGADLTDKTPLQDYQRATFSDVVEHGRFKTSVVARDITGLSDANIKNGIVSYTPTAAASIAAQNGMGGKVISALELTKNGQSFRFYVFNNATDALHTITLNGDVAEGVTYVGPQAAPTEIAAQSSAEFLVVRSSATEIIIYRLA